MKSNNGKVIFHIDVNSAFLSWEAAYRLQHGDTVDLRAIASVVGGNPVDRHGIVLAKSILAKQKRIETGETLNDALHKCPELVIVPPRYELYVRCSAAMHSLLQEYTPEIQRYSIDESFLNFSNMEHIYPDFIELAHDIKDRIQRELGFTVNIGISSNKLLAKMAGDFSKPNKVHTLFLDEIKDKMWPLPIEDLFMVGRATVPKLRTMNVNTIGDLANYDLVILQRKLKSQGLLIWQYANGIDKSTFRKSNHIEMMKGIGNSTTTSFDVDDRETAHKVILSLVETIGMRLRNSQNCCRLVAISIRTSDFINYSRQRKLYSATDSTKKIDSIACSLFDELWNGDKIRHIGVRVGELCTNEYYQCSLLDDVNMEKERSIDNTIDRIRERFGSKSIVRATFIHSGIRSITGGVGEEDYPLMSSLL